METENERACTQVGKGREREGGREGGREFQAGSVPDEGLDPMNCEI